MAFGGKRQTAERHPWLEVPTPLTRSLQVYAIDPSAGSYARNPVTVQVPWEPLAPGPAGGKVAVVDYDAANDCYYPPVDLEDPRLLARDGLDPSESDPRFHQQMVYAVACKTIEMFEVALGRDLQWRRADRSASPDAASRGRHPDDIWILNLYPHAMQEINAYYSPQAHGILFGYFAANEPGQGRNLPGQRVFTCLSRDIIAHEVTHAILDGIRTCFTEPTNPDVLAFHEAFADLSALFSQFAEPALLVDVIQRTGGRLRDTELGPIATRGHERSGGPAEPTMSVGDRSEQNPLVQLALQFGDARGAGRRLRSALGTRPQPAHRSALVADPHARGSILVAAVFDAFFSVYMGRARDLFRIHQAYGPVVTDELPAPLAELLARRAAETATLFFRLCVRALDYCPPVDITFGDFLRALVTVSRDLPPADRMSVRDAVMEGFRRRGIHPEGASLYSEDALCWPVVPSGMLPPIAAVPVINPVTADREVRGLIFGNPNGLTWAEQSINANVLRAWVERHRDKLGLDPTLAVAIPSFQPTFRTLTNGRLRVEMIVEVLQSRSAPFDPALKTAGSFPFRGGVTLVIEEPEGRVEGGLGRVTPLPEVRFVIGKPIADEEGERRERAQRSFVIAQGLAIGDLTDPNHFRADFGRLHGEL